jgi:hypothetical protein
VQRGFAGAGRHLCGNGDPGHDRERIAGEHKRPRIPVLAGYASVDENVLQLARAAAAERPHRQPRRAMAETQLQVGPEVRRTDVPASIASEYLEPWSRPVVRIWGDDLHGFTHDTKTQAAG